MIQGNLLLKLTIMKKIYLGMLKNGRGIFKNKQYRKSIILIDKCLDILLKN